jgi:aromatic ring-cleaving dioxygenase
MIWYYVLFYADVYWYNTSHFFLEFDSRNIILKNKNKIIQFQWKRGWKAQIVYLKVILSNNEWRQWMKLKWFVRSFRMNADSKMVVVMKFTGTKHNKHVEDMIWLGNYFFLSWKVYNNASRIAQPKGKRHLIQDGYQNINKIDPTW